MLALKPERPIQHIQLRPGVKPSPPLGYRVRILLDTVISKETSRDQLNRPKFKGEMVFAGTVIDVDIHNWVMLRDSLKAVVVDENTALFTAAPPPDPYADRPKLFREAVEGGLNTLADLAMVTNLTRLEASKIGRQLITDGFLSINDRGLYIRTAKKAA
jgi:hypothetical protein